MHNVKSKLSEEMGTYLNNINKHVDWLSKEIKRPNINATDKVIIWIEEECSGRNK